MLKNYYINKNYIFFESLLFFCMVQQLSFAAELTSKTLVPESRVHGEIGTRGMVVADDRVAAEWGAEILRRGGNAIDAAVATAFTMATTRPYYASLGGGGFMVYCPRSTQKTPSECYSLDFREQAPAGAHRDLYIRKGKADADLSRNGALASGVPGMPAGFLAALDRFGTFPRKLLLKKGIELAKKGMNFTAMMEWAARERWGAMNPEAQHIFGCDLGKQNLAPCEPGSNIRQPDLAKVLEKIAQRGAKEFYSGSIAKKLVKGLQQSGGMLTLEDLKNYQPKWRPVLKRVFQGSAWKKFGAFEVNTMGPPSSGGALLIQMLEYVQRAHDQGELKNGLGSVETDHVLAHAMTLAFSDRATLFGDPDFVAVPLEKILAEGYLNQQWDSFRSKQATDAPGSDKRQAMKVEPNHTTHFVVIDRLGNAVSVTFSVNDFYGSGFVPPGTGVVMNNHMDDFSAQPGAPNLFGLIGTEANSIAAHKRPLSSMTPTIVRDLKGNVRIAIGGEGGPRILTAVFQSLLNRMYFEEPLSDAVAAPRIHHQWRPNQLVVETKGIPFEIIQGLKEKGYSIEGTPRFLGKVHALERMPEGWVVGMPDVRGEGAAVPE